jgi:prepilin-type N-terminal cleavage/methylation domain-containing protein
MRLVHEESGFTLTEMLIVMTITTILMGGLATIFGIGLNTSKTASSILAAQSGVVVTLDRLDYEGRCASNAALVSGGAGVTLTFPNQCTHAAGTVTWCVTSGSLIRYSGSSCSGSGQTLVTDVSSATPFSCVTTGTLPLLKVALTVTANSGTTAAQTASGSDSIALRNASSAGACA